MPFDGCPHFAARDGCLYCVLPDGSEVLYWSPERGRALPALRPYGKVETFTVLYDGDEPTEGAT